MASLLHRRRKLEPRARCSGSQAVGTRCSGWVLALLVGCTSRPDGSDLFQSVGSSAFAEPLAPDAGIDRGSPIAPGPAVGVGAAGREEQTAVDLGPSGTGGRGGNGSVSSDPSQTGVDVIDEVEAFDAGAEDAATDARPPPCLPEPELCDGLDSDCDGDVDGATCAPGCTGFALAGHGYMFCATAVTRAQGLERCAQEGMRLVWLESAAESDALIDAIRATAPSLVNDPELMTQIGASDGATEGAWRWVGNRIAPDAFLFWQGGAVSTGGEALGGAYASWAVGEPNNTAEEDCATIAVIGSALHPAGSWDDRTCGTTQLFPFACEVP